MKRTLSLVLALVMVLGSFGTVFAVDTADKVEVGEFLETVGVLQGDEKGNLMLGNTLLRRDMVIMLSRLMGVEEVAKETPSEGLTFKDITDAHYNGYIAWSVNNGLIEGHSEELFGFNENVTAQQYAAVLMRALGYDTKGEAYKTVFEDAKKLGLIADVEVKNADEITRGQMAVMTFKALETPMKDSETTLAESLKIEMPVPVVTEATKVEKVYADNLKEVVVEFDGEVAKDSAELTANYSLDEGTISKAVLSEDMTKVVLTVDGDNGMKNQKERELTVRNIKTAEGKLNVEKIKFTPVDRAVPEITEVKGLGNKAVKVTFSEPVKNGTVLINGFKIDGKSISGSIDKNNGNTVIVKLYNKLSNGTHTIEVKGIKDFADYLMVTTEMEFEVEEDNEAPSIKSVEATLEYVTVTFSEPVQDSTVRGGSNGYWKATESTTVKNNSKTSPERISEDTYKFDFTDKPLPGYGVYLYIEGVKDYSDNTIAKNSPVLVNPVIDQVRPEVLSVKVADDNKSIEVKFSKAIDNITTKSKYELLDKDDKKVSIQLVTSEDNDKTATVKFYNPLKKGKYTFKMEGLTDKTALKNSIMPYSETLDIKSAVGPKADSYTVNGRDIYVKFNRKMTVDGEYGVGNLDNYFMKYNDVTRALPEDAEIQVFSEGQTVKITMPEKINSNAFDKVLLTELNVQRVKDIDGVQLDGYSQKITKDEVAFKVNKATLNDSKTIEIEFNRTIVGRKGNMTLTNAGGAGIESYIIDGDTVTLKLDKDVYSTKNLKLDAVSNTFELLENETSGAIPTFDAVKDEVSPKITKDNSDYGFTVTSGNQITIEFEEDIATTNATVYNAVLEVERVVGNKDAKDLTPANFTTEVDGNKVILTILSTAFDYKDGNVVKNDETLTQAYFTITLKENSLIKDLSGNSAEAFTNITTKTMVTK